MPAELRELLVQPRDVVVAVRRPVGSVAKPDSPRVRSSTASSRSTSVNSTGWSSRGRLGAGVAAGPAVGGVARRVQPVYPDGIAAVRVGVDDDRLARRGVGVEVQVVADPPAGFGDERPDPVDARPGCRSHARWYRGSLTRRLLSLVGPFRWAAVLPTRFSSMSCSSSALVRPAAAESSVASSACSQSDVAVAVEAAVGDRGRRSISSGWSVESATRRSWPRHPRRPLDQDALMRLDLPARARRPRRRTSPTPTARSRPAREPAAAFGEPESRRDVGSTNASNTSATGRRITMRLRDGRPVSIAADSLASVTRVCSSSVGRCRAAAP